ncbi:MAG TPA: pilus assembly protein TadG-related protein [Caulobacteraceae bacterium]|nr:pilus assembly protein TadG-related protein [Caulobacteraceae bacterium]
MARRWLRDKAGAISPLMGLLIIPLLGAAAMGTEAANWFFTQRAMQNAADSAVLAAATNGQTASQTSGGTTQDEFQWEGQSVSSKYGFTDGASNTTVTVANAQTCPDGTTVCYKVTITRHVPLWLSQIVGYHGNYTFSDGSYGTTIQAVALAGPVIAQSPLCLLSLDTSGANPAMTTNGSPTANLTGCSGQSNGAADCHGHNLGLDSFSSTGTDSGCGNIQVSNAPAVSDPFASLATNIPSDPCGGSYQQEPSGHGSHSTGAPLVAPNTPSGAVTWGAVQTFCGDVQLQGNVTIDSNTTIVIYNGQLDTNGFTIQTASGYGDTIVFTGSNTFTESGTTYTPTHTLTGGGVVDIAAPSSGTWDGVSIYTDPSLTSGVDMSAAGNSPTLDLSGVLYMPHSSITLSGAINHATHGLSCFLLVDDNLTINGTGSIFSNPQGQCAQAGYRQIMGETMRETLVG